MAIEGIEIIQRQTIRPSTPTPDNLKIFKLSLIDQFMPETYTPIVLFYPAKHGDSDDQNTKSDKLRTSLAQTLTQFYPLTGRLKDNSLIECQDQGAEYVEAQLRCSLSDILKNPDAGSLGQFLPAAIESSESVTGSLLLVQATFFDCGGLAIGVCISHKIADAATLAQFIKFWSRTANGSEVVAPVFMADSIIPPIEFSAPENSVEMQLTKCITKRFVFDGSKMAALKEIAASKAASNPTRVEAVSGLIWKGVITALKKSNPNLTRPSVWSVSVNLRPRFTPPVPENHAGNLVVIVTPKVEEEKDLKGLVGVIKEGMQDFVGNYVKKVQGEDCVAAICEFGRDFASKALSDKIDFFMCSGWCRFGLYDADFGWGKPTWLSIVSTNIRNVCILLDTKDEQGFEAWVTLSEEDMSWFEKDEQLLQFATVNPSVII